MSTSAAVGDERTVDDERTLRNFQTKLHPDVIDDVRHLAIDKRLRVWQIVEEALREKVARERTSGGGR